ncbi:pyrroline-5-carboxylate reductase 2 [Agrilus planipennis]|uniref:Pyrroline-5-carboxylate reductase n=1 Tax=Agrilus planipennis TaxID=224129 RepID=A0A7F5RE97_AGRPL|nr:pyrroline-5-carboxylate reductase 2 [Agrilus planipennis]
MTSKLLKIGFIGGGKMAQAMAKGFISAGLSKGEMMIASVHPSDLPSAEAFQSIGAESVFENIPVVKKSDVVFVSVKPSVIPQALGDITNADDLKANDADKLYLSIAMGVTIKELESYLPRDSRVIRVMPNTPALVRSAASVFVRGSNVTDEDAFTTKELLSSIGTCEEVTENLLDPITALSGSGPAYIYVIIEALADGGVKMGLPRDLAYRLAAQTVLGSGKMVLDTNTHPGILKDNVTSPAGSTASGLHFLEEKGLRAALIGAIEAATKRCHQVSSNGSTKK